MAHCSICGKPTTNKCGKCSNAWYCRTECQRSDWKNHKKVCNYPFEIKESEGKGLELFATRDLQIGDLVVREDPIMLFSSSIKLVLSSPLEFKHAYEKLGRKEKDKILALGGANADFTVNNMVSELSLGSSSTNEEWRRVLRIYGRNAIKMRVNSDEDGSALFVAISRINHSCSPNVEWSFLEEKRTSKEVRVIRNIKKGEEVLADYIADGKSFLLKSERKAKLKMGWNFDCSCSLCSSDCEENDALRRRVKQLHDEIPLLGHREDTVGAANAALQKCEILEKCEDLKSDLAVAYLELYETLIVLSHYKRLFGIDDALMGILADRRDEYREKAYQHCKKTKLVSDKELYNGRVEDIAMKFGGSRKLIQ